MIEINIAKEFSPATGFRTYDDGTDSGKEFYDKLLKNRFDEAIKQECKLKIILDGGEGYLSSFINEAFRLLVKDYDPDFVWNKLFIISNEMPKYIKKIKETIYEKK